MVVAIDASSMNRSPIWLANGNEAEWLSSFSRRRSCITCKRRKVKCNRSDPCSNCLKATTPCIYPTRNAKRTKAGTLGSRNPTLVAAPEKSATGNNIAERTLWEDELGIASASAGQSPMDNIPQTAGRKRNHASIETCDAEAVEARMLITDAGSRYMGSKFWASQSGEEVQALLSRLCDQELTLT